MVVILYLPFETDHLKSGHFSLVFKWNSKCGPFGTQVPFTIQNPDMCFQITGKIPERRRSVQQDGRGVRVRLQMGSPCHIHHLSGQEGLPGLDAH